MEDDEYQEDQRALEELERSHVSDTLCMDSKVGSCAAPGSGGEAVLQILVQPFKPNFEKHYVQLHIPI